MTFFNLGRSVQLHFTIGRIILTQDRLGLIKAEIISLLNENCFKVLLTKKVLINMIATVITYLLILFVF